VPVLGPGRASRAFIVGYLLVQVALPLRTLLRDPLDSPGDFGWTMYSDLVRCSVAYVRVDADGIDRDIDPRGLLNRASRIGRVLRRDRLPHFHAWLCEAGRPVYADVRCAVVPAPPRPLTDSDVDLCTAPGHGVRR
jgi:hypothetical protein